jgi:uncharacterized alpha-E superfamily protein
VLGGSESAAAQRRLLTVSNGAQPIKSDLPSRIADNLYWLGRYTERVEASVRTIRALLPALSPEEDFGRAVSLETAIRVLAGLKYLPPETAAASIGEQRWFMQRILTEMVYDPSQTSSLRWNLKEMRRAARNLKERLSSDTWRVLQQLDTEFSGFAPANADQRYFAEMDLLDSTVLTLSAFSGLLMENTTRGFGWRFLETGRRLERALQTADLLRSALGSAAAEIEPCLQILLQIADSSITYRTRYSNVLQTDLVLQLLVSDESNPRSVGFQVATLLHQIERLQENDEPGQISVEKPIAMKILTAVRQMNRQAVAQRNADGSFELLEQLMEEIKLGLYELSDALTARYLTPLTASRLTASS